MIWIVALGIALLGLWLWRSLNSSATAEESDFAKWKRQIADKERAERRPRPYSAQRLERQRHNEDRHY
jgi:hypothetical protein